MAKYKYLKVEYWKIKRHTVCTLTISNPQSLNSLNTAVLKELDRFIENINEDDNDATEALVITGDGDKSFVAGADIAEMSKLKSVEASELACLGTDTFHKIEYLRIPVIAAVNGYALGGGCELAMACDIRIAADTAKFAQPEVGLGIIPGFLGNYRLPRLVGIGRAKELIFTGRIVKAHEALEMGLVNKVVPKQDLMKAVVEMLEQILNNDSLAVSNAKYMINKACDGYAVLPLHDGEKFIEDEENFEENFIDEIQNYQIEENILFSMCFSKEGNAKKRMKKFLENQAKKNSNKEKK
ncbi:MAG: enoyl-CoA hydratase/isomerase family protein [Bacteroidales bacterium]|nr:enoyl-CoA hydratase/isomerase family protein [Bacteroidales bacterium]